ncbi:MAG TPA: DUF5993 family protein [Pirellulales bacterium]
MDTLIFLLIFGTLLAMRSGSRSLAIGLFAGSLLGTLWVFASHLTSTLNLNF